MPEIQIDLLKEIDSISQIHALKREDIDIMMVEFAERICLTLRIDRLSVWLFNKERDAIVSMGEYDLFHKKLTKNSKLLKDRYPSYFKATSENKIILVPNVYESQVTTELSEDYSKPNNVISLMDIPMRIEGVLVGVMCFEKTGTLEREFSERDRIFAMSVALVFASNLEARQRRALQHILDQELKEKDVLLKEVLHRVKNNLSVIRSLMNLQATKVKDPRDAILFEDCKTKVDAIAGIHDLIYQSESFSEVYLRDYFIGLVNDLHALYGNTGKEIKIGHDIQEVSLDVAKALPLALIINEVVSNAFKHAFEESAGGFIDVDLISDEEGTRLVISDNGKGFDWKEIGDDSMGLEIVKGLAEQLDAVYSFQSKNGVIFTLTFK